MRRKRAVVVQPPDQTPAALELLGEAVTVCGGVRVAAVVSAAIAAAHPAHDAA